MKWLQIIIEIDTKREQSCGGYRSNSLMAHALKWDYNSIECKLFWKLVTCSSNRVEFFKNGHAFLRESCRFPEKKKHVIKKQWNYSTHFCHRDKVSFIRVSLAPGRNIRTRTPDFVMIHKWSSRLVNPRGALCVYWAPRNRDL